MNSENKDNRRYEYGGDGFAVRPEYPVIAGWMPKAVTVLDLACGDGALLHYLARKNGVVGEGIERSESGVRKATAHGLKARTGEIDVRETYREIPDNAFDYAVCNVTLQMVMYPEVLIGEMTRIAHRQIVSFPNFGHVFNRIDHFLTGRMPRPQMFGYLWYDTGQIHQLGIADFLSLCELHSLRILKDTHQGFPEPLANFLPRLFSRTAIYLCERIS